MKPTPRPDHTPLKKLLSGVQRRRAQIAESLEQERLLKAEYDNWMRDTAPTDAERLVLIMPRKTQLDLHPAYRQRLERELGEGITALAAEADKFRAALVRAYSQELDAKATEVAEVLRPLFPDEINPINSQRTDRALNLARQSKDCTALHARIVELEGIRWADQPRSNNPSQWDGELLTAVESLLRFGENS